MNQRAICLLLLFSIFLTGAAAKGGPDRGELASLKEERRALHARIEGLKREQDYLVFQKMMYESDSKYLVIDIRNRTGRLKYKNRILKDFRFQTSKNFPRRSLPPGMLTLTEKVEGKKDRHALVFGKSLTVRWKRSMVPERQADIPYLSLARKDFLSVFYAVEAGSPAYLVR